MNLPNLRKQYKRNESKTDGLVQKWFEENYPFSCAIEVKIKGGKLLPHQQLALKQVQDGGFSYKIPDMGRRNPFDIMVLKGAHAFVVTCDGMKCHAKRIDGSQEFMIDLRK